MISRQESQNPSGNGGVFCFGSTKAAHQRVFDIEIITHAMP